MSALSLLQANLREKTGKGPGRALRRAGKIPAIIYGKGRKEAMIILVQQDIQRLYEKFTFMSTVIEIELDGKQYKVLPKSILKHPVTDLVEHVDFMYLNQDEKIKLNIPVLFTGKEKSLGLKRGGVLNIVLRNLPVIVDSSNIPAVIEIDVEHLEIGEAVHIKDINLPQGVLSAIKDSNYTVAKVVGKKAMKIDEEIAVGVSSGGGAEGESNKEKVVKARS